MSIDYLAAEDELIGIANQAWLAAVSAAGLPYAPVLNFPGVTVAPPDVSRIFGQCGYTVVDERQNAVGQNSGQRMYETTGLFSLQTYSPKTDASAFRIAKTIASAVRDAFRQPSPSGEIWFRNQRLTPVSGNEIKNQVNVIVTCVYKTIK